MPSNLPLFIPLGTIIPRFGDWIEFPNPSTNGGIYRLQFVPLADKIDSEFHFLLRRKWGVEGAEVVERAEFFYPKDESIVFKSFPEPFFKFYYGFPKFEGFLGFKRRIVKIDFKIFLEEIESDPYLLDLEVFPSNTGQ